jgi:hypothetical protein
MQLSILRKISIFLFFILFFSGCTPEWRRYDNKEFKFSILLPGSWKIEQGAFNTIVMALPVGQKNNLVSNRSINVIVTELSEDFSLNTFFELNKEELQRTLVVDNQIYDGEIYAGPLLGKWVIFEHLLEKVRLKTISAVWMKGRRIYTVTCSCQLEDFAKYKPVFDKVLRSLRIKQS